MAVLSHAWTKKGAAPPEWIEYVFCHYVLPGITPEQMSRMDYETVKTLMICYSEDNKMRTARGG